MKVTPKIKIIPTKLANKGIACIMGDEPNFYFPILEARNGTMEQKNNLVRFFGAAPELYSALHTAERAIKEAASMLHHEDGRPREQLEPKDIERIYLTLLAPLAQIKDAMNKGLKDE